MEEQTGAAAGGSLTGIRVIDLSAVVSGPFGTSILADQGADVISVEQVHAPTSFVNLDETDTPDLSTVCNLFPTSDGWAMIYPPGTDAQWLTMCEALNRADLASDLRFADLHGRITHGSEINQQLQRETRSFTTAALVKLMDEADVPAAPVNTREGMIADPHVQYRGIVEESVHPTAGRIRSVRSPALFSKTVSAHSRHAPLFGEHTDDVLTELLAMTPAELATLRADGVIARRSVVGRWWFSPCPQCWACFDV